MSNAIQRLQDAAKRARLKTQSAEQGIVRKCTLAATGAGLGFAKKKGMAPEVGGVPTKLVIAGLGTVAEIMTRGAVQRFVGAVADASIAVFAHEAVEAGSFVAGTTEVSGGAI